MPEVNQEEALDCVMELMAIPGKSTQETEVAGFLTDQLVAMGVPTSAIQFDTAHRKSPAGGAIGNLIVKLPGSIKAPRRLLMAHMDTVPLCVGSRPERSGGVIVSRDADTALGGDDRAGTAVILTAIREIIRQDLPCPPLTLFWPVQEEIGLLGARHVSLSKLGRPKLCFNWDGGPPNMAVVGATGDYDIHITIDGIASHAGAHPELGVNAIAIAAVAIADLTENGWHGLIIKGRRTGTSNIGIINGGDATNVVTPQVKLRAEARSHDPKFRQKIVDEIHKAFKRAVKQVKSSTGQQGKLSFQADLKYESFMLPEGEACVESALQAISAVGLPASTRISNGGLDANWMTAHGYPTVTIGCGQQDIHTVNESLDIAQYLFACRIALVLATGAV